MTQTIIINPVTRISGFLEISAVVENNIVTDAKTSGLLFRGFEKMLSGRNPFDVVYFTQRICGICSAAHSMASALALEDALGIIPTEQGRYLRDIIHGSEFLQNHIRQFYQYTVPDYVRLPEGYPLFTVGHEDFRLPKAKNDLIVEHYFESLELSRDAHQMLAVLGGKAPHNHGVFIGGITTQATAYKIIKIKSILNNIQCFVEDKMIPDVYTIARYYEEYFHLGGSYGNLLTYGCFNNYRDLGTLYVDPLVYYSNGVTGTFSANNITEEIDYSWYTDQKNTYHPFETIPENNMDKTEAYSWVKAARYHNLPFEVGPLARQWLSGGYKNGISAMDRTIARVLETKKITEIISTLLDNLIPGIDVQKKYSVPLSTEGSGLVDTTRGALGHWLKIQNGLISFYQIITPSVWNLSTRGNDNSPGTGEKALINTPVKNINQPVELGRIIRSFDPCISCATHVYHHGEIIKSVTVIP